jgi:uncharacterized SAM-binding protein YcdF (DUF218 family)
VCTEVAVLKGFAFASAVRTALQGVGLVTLAALAAAVLAFPMLASWLQYQDRPAPADYIVPITGDAHRLIKAAELYRAGLAPKILLSNERTRPPSRLSAISAELGFVPKIDSDARRLRLLEHLGVPAGATATYGHALVSTVDEAEALRRLIGDKPHTLIVVTSPYQARRAKLVFEHALPAARILIVWPPEGALPERWWSDKDAAVYAVLETTKIVNFWFGRAFRAAHHEVAPAGAAVLEAPARAR